MSVVVMIYDAKCKHCFHFTSEKTGKVRRQSYCSLHKKFLTLKSKACPDLKL